MLPWFPCFFLNITSAGQETDESGCVRLNSWGIPADTQSWFLLRLQTLHRVPAGLFPVVLSVWCRAFNPEPCQQGTLQHTHSPTHSVHPPGVNPVGPDFWCVCTGLVGMQCLCCRAGHGSLLFHGDCTQSARSRSSQKHTQSAVTAQTLQNWDNLLIHKKHQKGAGTCSLLCCLGGKNYFCIKFILYSESRFNLRSGGLICELGSCFSQFRSFSCGAVRSCA